MLIMSALDEMLGIRLGLCGIEFAGQFIVAVPRTPSCTPRQLSFR
jgi:hypothetical protein